MLAEEILGLSVEELLDVTGGSLSYTPTSYGYQFKIKAKGQIFLDQPVELDDDAMFDFDTDDFLPN